MSENTIIAILAKIKRRMVMGILTLKTSSVALKK
jgi:hypothetical protein